VNRALIAADETLLTNPAISAEGTSASSRKACYSCRRVVHNPTRRLPTHSIKPVFDLPSHF